MSTLDRFTPRLQNLPSYLRLRPGYIVIEEQPGQFLFHSNAQSFKISLPFPGISLPEFFKGFSGEQSLTEILGTLPPFYINFLLDIVETLYHSGLLVADRNSNSEGDLRYTASAHLFDQLQSSQSDNTLKPLFSENIWQDRIAKARIGLIGLGRIGSQLARLLTIVGALNITGIDEGIVDETLRYTDAWYFEGDRGELRVQALGRNLFTLNPQTRFSSLATSLGDLEQDIFPDEFFNMDVIIVASDQHRPNLYERINTHCIQAGIPWTSYRPGWTGLTVEIGPTVLPKVTACYECYQQRRRSNLANPKHDDMLAAALKTHTSPLLNLQITPCLSLFCYEILHLLSGITQPRTLGAIMEFSINTSELIRHPLLKIPRCPACRRDIQSFVPVRFWSEISTAINNTAFSYSQTGEV